MVLKTISPKIRLTAKLKTPTKTRNKKPVRNPALAKEKGIPKIPTPTMVPIRIDTAYKNILLSGLESNDENDG